MTTDPLDTYLDLLYGRSEGYTAVTSRVYGEPWWRTHDRWRDVSTPRLPAQVSLDLGDVRSAIWWKYDLLPDLYLPVHPRCEPLPWPKRGGRADVASVATLVADLDWHDELRHKGENLPSPSERRALAALLPDPSMLVGTGAGVHGYWSLREPLPVDLGHRAMRAWRALVEHHAASLGQPVDGAVCDDLARVLRPPGTWNAKVPEEPLSVRLIEASGRLYEPSELIGGEAWELAQRPSPRETCSIRHQGGTGAGWVEHADPLAAAFRGEHMVALLVEAGWSVEREGERDGDPYWALCRPGKARGTSASVRQFSDHTVLFVFSDSAETEPFVAGEAYGARRFLKTFYGPRWREAVREGS